jgi:hypothetical protein
MIMPIGSSGPFVRDLQLVLNAGLMPIPKPPSPPFKKPIGFAPMVNAIRRRRIAFTAAKHTL